MKDKLDQLIKDAEGVYASGKAKPGTHAYWTQGPDGCTACLVGAAASLTPGGEDYPISTVTARYGLPAAAISGLMNGFDGLPAHPTPYCNKKTEESYIEGHKAGVAARHLLTTSGEG